MPAFDRMDAASFSQIGSQDQAQQVWPPLGIHRRYKLIRLVNDYALHRIDQAVPDDPRRRRSLNVSQSANSHRGAIAYPPPSLSAQGSAALRPTPVDNICGQQAAAIMAKKEIKPRRLAA